MANQVLLLAASLYFYACWNPLYLCLIVFSVLATWWGGLALENKTVKQKRIVVALVIFVNLMILFFFKYYNFFCDSVDWFAQIFSKQHKKIFYLIFLSCSLWASHFIPSKLLVT